MEGAVEAQPPPQVAAARVQLPLESYNIVSERRKLRKTRRRRGPAGVGVVEAAVGADEDAAEQAEKSLKRPQAVDHEELQRRRTYRKLGGVKGLDDVEGDENAAFDRLPTGLASVCDPRVWWPSLCEANGGRGPEVGVKRQVASVATLLEHPIRHASAALPQKTKKEDQCRPIFGDLDRFWPMPANFCCPCRPMLDR